MSNLEPAHAASPNHATSPNNETAQAEARAVKNLRFYLVAGSAQALVVPNFRPAIGNLQQFANSCGEQKRYSHPHCQSFQDTHMASSVFNFWDRDSASIISASPTLVKVPQSILSDSSLGNPAPERD